MTKTILEGPSDVQRWQVEADRLWQLHADAARETASMKRGFWLLPLTVFVYPWLGGVGVFLSTMAILSVLLIGLYFLWVRRREYADEARVAERARDKASALAAPTESSN